jgi:hypothetical protein
MSIKGQSFTGDTTGALVNFGVGTAGAANIFTGAFTWVCLSKYTSQNWGMGGGFSDTVGGTQEGGLLVSAATGGGHLFSIDDFTNGFPNTGDLAGDVWRWQVITKPAGNAHYRYHYADLSTLTWVHGESVSSANHADHAAVVAFSTWSVYALGFDSGDMAVLAGFNYEMTDQQVQAACTKILRDLKYAAGGSPKIGWAFPQASYNVATWADFTNGGGDETLRQLTAASADPPNFDFGIVVENDPAWVTAGGGSAVGLNSASFNTSANSLIVVQAHVDGTGGAPGGWTIGDSLGNSLPWIEIGTVQQAGSGGYIRVWSAFVAAAQTGITANVDFQTNNAKAVKVTTYLGTDPAKPPIQKFSGSSATNNLTQNVTNTYAGGWIAGSALDWNALGTPASVDTAQTYNLTSLISGLSAREPAPTMLAGQTVGLNFDAAGSGTPDWAVKIFEIVPLIPVASAQAAPQIGQIVPWELLKLLIEDAAYGYLSVPASSVTSNPETGLGALGLSGSGAQVKRATPVGRSALGMSGTATEAKTATPTGRAAIGLAGIATAAKVMAQSARVAAGLAAVATAKKVAPQASVDAVGLSGAATVKKIATPSTIDAMGLSGSATALKKAPETGAGYIALTPYGPTQGQRPQTGRSALGLSGRAVAGHASTGLVGRSVVGFVGVSAIKKSVGLSGNVAAGLSGRGAQVKRATPSASASVGLTANGTPKHTAGLTGRTALGLSASGTTSSRKPVSGRTAFGMSGYGVVYKPVSINHLAGATLLLAPGPVRLHTSGNDIALQPSSGPIKLHEATTTQ